jgi:hypothetical protein
VASVRDVKSVKFLTFCAAACFLLNIHLFAQADKTASSSFPKELKVLTRKAWKASEPVKEMTTHELKRITIHHSGVKQHPDKTAIEKLKGLQGYSQHESTMANGKKKPVWPDVPYHFYVTSDGRIAEGREIKYVGDTNTEYDPTGHILICVEGNFETEEPSEGQMKSTCKLVRWLAEKYNISADKISAHKDHASTVCPGKNLYAKIPEIREYVIANTPTK